MSATRGPGHDHWEDASGAYLLGALSPEEAAAYAAHLEICPACRAEVEDLQFAADALPASVLPVAVPAGVGERVMAEVRREAEAARPARRPRRARAGWRGRLPIPALAAAAVLVGLAVGLGAALLLQGGERTVEVAASGAARGAHVRLVLGGRATLEADHLPAPAGGRVYQVWLKPPGKPPEPTGSLFVPRRDGHATVAVPAAVERMEALLVTAEPQGGSPVPTSAPVLVAKLS